MIFTRPLPSQTARELEAIRNELASVLARYRRLTPLGDGRVYAMGDILRMHEQVWDAVAMLRASQEIPESQTTLLTLLYRTRRDSQTGAVTLSGLAEIIELLGRLLGRQSLH